MKLAVHIAYYNDAEDLKYLADKSADEIVKQMKAGFGAITTIDNGNVFAIEDFPEDTIELTTDGKYLVQNDTPTDLNLIGEKNVSQSYIDIYEIEEVEDDEWDEEEGVVDFGGDDLDFGEEDDEDDAAADGQPISIEEMKALEPTLKKLEWLEKNDNDALIDLWGDYLDEILSGWNIYDMDDFDEAMGDLTPKEIMEFSNGNFNSNHKYYAFNEDFSAYISFDTMADYECYVKEKVNFAMFLKREGYIL